MVKQIYKSLGLGAKMLGGLGTVMGFAAVIDGVKDGDFDLAWLGGRVALGGLSVVAVGFIPSYYEDKERDSRL